MSERGDTKVMPRPLAGKVGSFVEQFNENSDSGQGFDLFWSLPGTLD
jgi:hypothetical protein